MSPLQPPALFTVARTCAATSIQCGYLSPCIQPTSAACPRLSPSVGTPRSAHLHTFSGCQSNDQLRFC